ncbi:hypothetical protein CQJ34_26180, partial [Salmonella enterica subsp. enterica serovar Heidelberg]
MVTLWGNYEGISQGKASSTDYGLMQINSTHIPKLIKMGVIKKSEDLITKPCLNIH